MYAKKGEAKLAPPCVMNIYLLQFNVLLPLLGFPFAGIVKIKILGPVIIDWNR